VFRDSLYSLFFDLSFMILRIKDSVYISTRLTFSHLKCVYENSASSDDLACSKRIFAYFCTHMSYDCSLDTLDTDVFYNSNHRTA